MNHIELLYQELIATPNDMLVRMALTDACAEAGVYCPDLLGQSFPSLFVEPSDGEYSGSSSSFSISSSKSCRCSSSTSGWHSKASTSYSQVRPNGIGYFIERPFSMSEGHPVSTSESATDDYYQSVSKGWRNENLG